MNASDCKIGKTVYLLGTDRNGKIESNYNPFSGHDTVLIMWSDAFETQAVTP